MTIREKILVIEDEKSISHFISTVLNNNGYEASYLIMDLGTGRAGQGWSGHPPQPAQLVQPAGGGGLRPLP